MERAALIDLLFSGFEAHSPEKIKTCIGRGMNMSDPIEGRRPIDILISMYLRSDRLGSCLQLLLDAGVNYDDKALLNVLMGKPVNLSNLLEEDPELLDRRYTIPCAFIPLEEATLLHIAAEYGRPECTRVLLEHGEQVDVRAGFDEQGFGGQTPLFHTVNTHQNYCRSVMDVLLEAGASLDLQLKGIVWGKDMEWETLIPEVNPVSYAMMGNLEQFHRNPVEIADNVRAMMKYKYSQDIHIRNVPNAYVLRSRKMASSQ